MLVLNYLKTFMLHQIKEFWIYQWIIKLLNRKILMSYPPFLREQELSVVSLRLLGGRTMFYTFMISSHFFSFLEWQDHAGEMPLRHYKLVSHVWVWGWKNRAR